MPLILSGNVATATASTTYDVANSCRFNSADQARMNRDLVTATSRQKFTYSFWIKRCSLSQQFVVTNAGSTSHIKFDANHKLDFMDEDGNIRYITTRVFRDVSAWYSIIIAVDTTQGTAGNRVKIYINGTQETSFSTSTAPDQNYNCTFNTAVNFKYGSYDNDADYNLDAYLAELVFIDGTQYANTDFGEFDEESPKIWKPKKVSGLTFGTNGHYLDFEASGNLGNDANGGTDWTEENLAATDQSLDTCTNNFCTLNPLVVNSGLTYSEGNLNVVASNANYRHAVSTIAVQSGKWYAEFKAVSGFSGVDKNVGIYRTDNNYSATTGLGNYTSGTTWCYGATGNVRTSNGNNDTGEATFTDGDIIAVAMDLDNNKLYFAKNNAWINSGDPESGATGTGSYAIVAGDFYHFAVTSISSGGAALWSCNFGSPSYANSSDAADANGYGAFEYAPPSGYLALCTKNLGSDGG